MWARVRTTVIKKDKKQMKESDSSLNVNNEYLCAFRTKSYVDFYLKAQSFVNQPTSSPAYNRHCPISEVLLDPGQETITEVLESAFLSNKSSDLKSLFLNYFDISAEASRFCSQLLRSLSQVQSDYRFIHQVLNSINDGYSSDDQEFDSIFSELRSCVILKVPFSDTNKQDFRRIHEKHSSVLQHLKSKRKRVARKIKFIKFFNKSSGVCVAAAAVALAVHNLKKKSLSFRVLKYEFQRKIGKQLDVAAKVTYILDRDFDTMSLLVDRLQDEIEHNKAMIQFCLDRREQRLSYQVLKEIRKCEFGFLKQVEELEEHVYLCLITINRGRALVIKEISSIEN